MHLWRSQRQIWDILQGVSSLEVQLTRKFLVRYDRIPLFRLNELGEKLQATIILGKFVNKSYANSHWLIVFGKCFPLVKIKARSHDVFFSWVFNLFLINTSRDLVLGVYFTPLQRNIGCEYKLHGKPIMK